MATFYHKTKMVEHLEKEHLIPCENDQLEFETEKQFLIWKEKEVATTMCISVISMDQQLVIFIVINTTFVSMMVELVLIEEPLREKSKKKQETCCENRTNLSSKNAC